MNGDLVYTDNQGKEHIIFQNKPFALLNHLKQQIKNNYNKNSLKIKYHK